MAATAHHPYGLPITGLRLFPAFGPRNHPDLAIARLAGLILRGEPVPMFGDGSSRRNYTHVNDIAAGIAAALDRTTGHHLDNLGHADPVPLRALIATLGTALGREPVINQLPPSPATSARPTPTSPVPAPTSGYDPRTSLAAGLARSVAWLRTTPPTWFAKRTHRPQPVCRQ